MPQNRASQNVSMRAESDCVQKDTDMEGHGYICTELQCDFRSLTFFSGYFTVSVSRKKKKLCCKPWSLCPVIKLAIWVFTATADWQPIEMSLQAMFLWN